MHSLRSTRDPCCRSPSP